MDLLVARQERIYIAKINKKKKRLGFSGKVADLGDRRPVLFSRWANSLFNSTTSISPAFVLLNL